MFTKSKIVYFVEKGASKVNGYGGSDAVADFMYRFHMPLFFILSGYFMQKHSNVSEYATNQFKKLMIPYFMYMEE